METYCKQQRNYKSLTTAVAIVVGVNRMVAACIVQSRAILHVRDDTLYRFWIQVNHLPFSFYFSICMLFDKDKNCLFWNTRIHFPQIY